MKAPRYPQVGSSLSANFRTVAVVLSVCCITVVFAPLTRAQKQAKIEVVSPTATAKQQLVSTGGTVKIVYKVNDDDIDSIRFKIDAPPYDAASGSADFKKEGSHTFTAKLFKGKNTIHLFGFNGPDAVKTAAADVVVFCNNECAGPTSPKDPGSSNEGGTGEAKPDSNITIQSPTGAVTEGTVESLILVKGGITKLSIAVYDSEKHLVDYKDSVAVRALPDSKSGFVAPELKVVKGKNLIRVFDADPAKFAEKANEALVVVTCDTCGKFDAAAAAAEPKPEQKGNLKITSAKSITYGDKKEAKIKVKFEKPEAEAATEKKVIVEVVNNKKTTKSDPQTLNSGTDKELSVKLGSGENKITVYEEGNRETQRDFATVTCEGKCGNDADAKEIAIVQPKIPGGATSLDFTDKSTQVAYVTVTKGSKIKTIQYDVINEGKPVLTSPPVAVNTTANDLSDDVTVPMTLKFLKGTNTIRIYDADHPGSNNDASIVIKCTGDNCATDFLVATIPTNSRFTRAIVGMEQAGASSADSTTNPFLDFFFTTPLLFRIEKGWVPDLDENGVQKRDADGMLKVKWGVVQGLDHKPVKIPTLGAWGQVRFSTTPEQVSAFAVFPSNFVNQISDPTKVVNLVQSFDFLAGAEYRAFNSNGWIWTLIPGVKQRTSFYFTFGGGAISPVSVRRESAQLFIVPPDAVPATGTNPAKPVDPRRAEFIRRFGDPKTLTYVGFAPLERDRFFRQYYFGIRLKTHYCEDEDCHRFVNRFPSIIDLGFGQNEAVTGGKWRYDVRDSANSIIGQKRAWVMRLDAFFPLPFKEANFLYLYGTALMKIGGGGVKIQNPLFLDTPTSTIQITDVNVYIPPPDLQPTRMDRDYYKIGIGVNLTDLFNRNKPKP